jgi:hypothetical protein
MKVKTYNLEIVFPTTHLFFNNVSRVALQRYLSWYNETYGDGSFDTLITEGETKCR